MGVNILLACCYIDYDTFLRYHEHQIRMSVYSILKDRYDFMLHDVHSLACCFAYSA